MSARNLMEQSVLYGIIDSGYVQPQDFETRLRQLAEGGITLVQFRAKNKEKSQIAGYCLQLAPLCKELNICFIVNDYPDIALACHADGVHIGQDDGAIADIRALVGDSMIIGRSTHSSQQAIAAYQEGADYIGFGPLFPTMTKPGRPAIGLDDIAYIHKTLPKNFPIFCIGGIKQENLENIQQAGAKRIVVVSWILNNNAPARATQDLINKLSPLTL